MMTKKTSTCEVIDMSNRMKRLVGILVVLVLVLGGGGVLNGQEKGLDEVSKKASGLEAGLSKTIDRSPEAGRIMVELVNLYHEHGRVFGLIRTGERFVTAQPRHREHRAVMLKYLDGLVAASRTEQIVATARQFLSRYGKDGAAVRVGRVLARTLERAGKVREAAAAYEGVWKLGGAAAREDGVKAIRLLNRMNNGKSYLAAAKLAEEMVDRLKKGRFAAEVAVHGFGDARRASAWSVANVLARKVFAKGLPLSDEQKRYLHLYVAENYAALGQYTNAVAAMGKARGIRSTAAMHKRHVEMLSAAKGKAGEIERVARAYAKAYPKRRDRFGVLSYVSYAYQREGRTGEALRLLAEILGEEAVVNDIARRYVEWTPKEKYGEAEKVLLGALGKNKRNEHRIAYALAFDLYRDRMKDSGKAKAMAEQMVMNHPSNDYYVGSAISYLLYVSKTEDAARAMAGRILKAARGHEYLADYVGWVSNWTRDANRRKEYRAAGKTVRGLVSKFREDQFVKNWVAAMSRSSRANSPRAWLLTQKLSDGQARVVLGAHAYYTRHYTSSRNRPAAVGLYGRLAKRFPKDYDAARHYLHTATDYGKSNEQRGAVEHWLKLEAPYNDSDSWRRALSVAVKAKDEGLMKRVMQVVEKSQKEYGVTVGYGREIGDVLTVFKQAGRAKAYWQARVGMQPSDWQSHYVAASLVKATKDAGAKKKLIESLMKVDSDYHGTYASWLADLHFKAGEYEEVEQVMRAARARQDERPFRSWGLNDGVVSNWLYAMSRDSEIDLGTKKKLYAMVRDLRIGRVSGGAAAAYLLTGTGEELNQTGMGRLMAFAETTYMVGRGSYDWRALIGYAQGTLARKQYSETAALLTAMLANIRDVDSKTKKSARAMIGQAYARMGTVGLAIDENSPMAPLLRAALYLRLGDKRLALAAYQENPALFDKHRLEVPVDLLLFAAESHITASGEEQHNRAEDMLRAWMIKFEESKDVGADVKARVQLMLAKNYFKAGRFDVARAEYTTVTNKYPKTPQATEAKFGVGECYMAQKIYDKAEEVFTALAGSKDRDIIVRAEFLRGVLAYRRGDKDEARAIFKRVLERVPNISLANQALFNLAEVYGSEQRHMDQLELLRTVGRLGRKSKRWHEPGRSLSIVVQDPDLGISRGHTKIPVIVTTKPGGDKEMIYLQSGGAGKGLFRADVVTQLGAVIPGDKTLQITGRDVIRVDYPDEFKTEFKFVPLSDAEIHMAADARFDVASSKIVDKEEETFSQRLAREAKEKAENADKRKSQGRSSNEIRPGNVIYIRVKDPDRDLSDQEDGLSVKLVASSGDQVQIELRETGPHTGVFEGTAKTGELPAGALATDHAIDHSPLMAIDHDEKSYWLSEPDGVTPKALTVDMKDLRSVNRVMVASPAGGQQSPVRMQLQGSHDGRYWYRLVDYPVSAPVVGLIEKFGSATQRVYRLPRTTIGSWTSLVSVLKSGTPVDEAVVEKFEWALEKTEGKRPSTKPYAVVWYGKFAQPRDGAVRFKLTGSHSAVMVNGHLELPLGKAERHVDVYLSRGLHDVTLVSLTTTPEAGVSAMRARENPNAEQVTLANFRASDFDAKTLGRSTQPKEGEGKVAVPATPITVTATDALVSKKSKKFGVFSVNRRKVLGSWVDAGDTATWKIDANAPGVYGVFMTWSHDGAGSKFELNFGDQVIKGDVVNTRSWSNFTTTLVGTVKVEKAGEQTLTIKPVAIANGGLMDLERIVLKPMTGAAAIVSSGKIEFQFETAKVRYVRARVDEYTGEAVAINHMEIGNADDGKKYIPTKQDVLSLSKNDVLEIAAGDVVTASYTDEFTTGGLQRNRLLTRNLTATYHNGKVRPIGFEVVRQSNGSLQDVRKDLMRIDPGDRVTIEVTDYDMDTTEKQDKVEVLAWVNDGKPIKLTAVETGEYTGVFQTEVDTTATDERGKLTVKKGDRLYMRYLDRQNTFPGHSVSREAFVFVNEPSDGRVRIVQTRFVRPRKDSAEKPKAIYLPTPDALPVDYVAGVSYELPLTVEVIDPDAAKDSLSKVMVKLRTTDGVELNVECVISQAFANKEDIPADVENWALLEGRFVGQVVMQLGGKNSPKIIPVTDEGRRSTIGGPRLSKEELKRAGSLDLSMVVLNLTGKDIVDTVYNDKLRPDGKAVDHTVRARLIAEGTLAVTDKNYEKEVTTLHLGEKLYLVVNDPDVDRTDARDKVTVEITTKTGEREQVELNETLSHSGVFTGSFVLKAREKPTADNHKGQELEVEAFFGDMLSVKYVDQAAPTEDGTLELRIDTPVAIGTNGLLMAFSKNFANEELAVETRFHIAESYFELFKSHKKLGREEEMNRDLEAGRLILKQVMEDYPDPKYAPRVAYLLGQFAQELKQYDEAIEAYTTIIRQYSDHILAPDAQYKIGQCYQASKKLDEALEAFVTLAATYPKSPLIATVMIRIAEHFYQDKNYTVAAQVASKFLERFGTHQYAPQMAFRVGICRYREEKFALAGAAFDAFSKKYPDSSLAADGLFWAGESYFKAKNIPVAFRRYNRCRWDYPETESAKYARGRLTLPEMLAQFEREAQSIENDQ